MSLQDWRPEAGYTQRRLEKDKETRRCTEKAEATEKRSKLRQKRAKRKADSRKRRNKKRGKVQDPKVEGRKNARKAERKNRERQTANQKGTDRKTKSQNEEEEKRKESKRNKEEEIQISVRSRKKHEMNESSFGSNIMHSIRLWLAGFLVRPDKSAARMTLTVTNDARTVGLRATSSPS